MKLINTRRLLSAATIVTLIAGFGTATIANAAPITPQYDSFGPLPQATFGGTGIPNDAVAATTTIDNNGNTITLGLTATERAGKPAVTNDGQGTFFATPGSDPTASYSGQALWNFDFYGDVSGGEGTLADYNFVLLYDFDPGVGTDESDHGSLDAAAFGKSATRFEDSQNLGFHYLAADNMGFNTAPTGPGFDPTLNGEYTFALQAFDPNGGLLGQSAIRVNVGDVTNNVPEPSSIAMLGLGLIGLGFAFGFRRRQAKAPANFA